MMIRPEDVTDAMVEVLHEKYDIAGRIGTPTKVAARIAIAAAINASGCVLVPRGVIEEAAKVCEAASTQGSNLAYVVEKQLDAVLAAAPQPGKEN